MSRFAIAPAILITTLLVPAQGLLSAAEAGIGFSIRGGFRVGGLHFSLGLHEPGPYYRAGYYYRVYDPIPYYGHRCGSVCYRHEGAYYHHEACPLVLHHFRRHGHVPPHFRVYGGHYGGRRHYGPPYWYGVPGPGYLYYPYGGRRYGPGYRPYGHDRHRRGYRPYGHDHHRRGYRPYDRGRRYAPRVDPYRDRAYRTRPPDRRRGRH